MVSKILSSASKANVALAGATLLALTVLPARGATLTDVYSGGYNSYNSPSDVIGTNTFNTTDAVVTRSGPGNSTLNVTINTYYAGAPGTSAAEGTGYGSLFFSTTGWAPTGLVGSSPNLYPQDKYTANQWNYVFTVPQNPGSGSIGSTPGALYAIGGNATAVPYGPTPSVAQSYKTDNGSIIMSNVNGDPVTAPGANNPGFYFREGQAVQYTPDDASKTAALGSWSVAATVGSVEGSITFSILDNGLLGNSFALAWAMTCANDVIQGPILLRGDESFPTPLPAALPLFAGGLGVMGLLGWRRKRKS